MYLENLYQSLKHPLKIFVNDIDLWDDIKDTSINNFCQFYIYISTVFSTHRTRGYNNIHILTKLPQNQDFDGILVNSDFMITKLEQLSNQFYFIITNNYLTTINKNKLIEKINYQFMIYLCDNRYSDKILAEKQFQQKKIILPELKDINTYTPNVYIIIPIYNQAQYTIKLLKSIEKYAEQQYKIICVLIDNGSDQKNKTLIHNYIINLTKISIQFINFDKPIGYVKATNTGIKYALQNNANYICLQNNDTEVTQNWMTLLISNIKGQIAGTSPTTNSDKAIQGFNSIRNLFFADLPLNIKNYSTEQIANILKEKYSNKIIQISNQHKYFNNQLFILSFFCMMFRADIFKQFLLDQCFGTGYAEDVDFCLRLLNYGINIAYTPACYVLHNHRTTFSTVMSSEKIQEKINANLYLAQIINLLNPVEYKENVIYTANIGNYDNFSHHIVYNTEKFDYVYFTTTQNTKNIPRPWKVIYVDKLFPIIDLENKNDNVRLARWFKTHPHIFFRNYKTSIWVDGNTPFITDPINLLNKFSFQDILTQVHPTRNCIYTEAQCCINWSKDNNRIIQKEIALLKSQNYPEEHGLVQTNILVRHHNTNNCKKFMEQWWKMIKNYSRRDQLSFNYIQWKLNILVTVIPFQQINKNYITWQGKHDK